MSLPVRPRSVCQLPLHHLPQQPNLSACQCSKRKAPVHYLFPATIPLPSLLLIARHIYTCIYRELRCSRRSLCIYIYIYTYTVSVAPPTHRRADDVVHRARRGDGGGINAPSSSASSRLPESDRWPVKGRLSTYARVTRAIYIISKGRLCRARIERCSCRSEDLSLHVCASRSFSLGRRYWQRLRRFNLRCGGERKREKERLTTRDPGMTLEACCRVIL